MPVAPAVREIGGRGSQGLARISVSWLLAALLTLTALNCRSARADESYTFFQIACVPKLSYFTIRRFDLLNLRHDHPYSYPVSRSGDAPARLKALRKEYAIYDVIELRDNPFSCEIPPLRGIPGERDRPGYRVRVTGQFDDDNGEASSPRQIVDFAEVFVDDKSIAALHRFIDPITPGAVMSVEVSFDGVEIMLRTCLLTAESFSGIAVSDTVMCHSDPLTVR